MAERWRRREEQAPTQCITDAPKQITIYPWHFLPDPLVGLLGCLALGPALPVFAIIIVVAEFTWWCLCKAADALPLMTIVNWIHARGCDVGRRVCRDPRDAPYVLPIAFLSLWGPSLFLWSLSRYVEHGFEVSTFLLYHFLRIGPRFRFFAHVHVLLHKEGHATKGLFRGPFRALNGIAQWWIGPFYGQVPNSYAVAHNKIHHVYDNMPDDSTSTLDLDRTKMWSFILYMPRFALYWSSIGPAIQLWYRGQYDLAKRLAAGCCLYFGVFVAFFLWDPTFALTFYAFPHCEAIIFFGGISYLWHAWCDPDDPHNPYINSVTILEGKDNIWNEDYHVIHHEMVTKHWTEAPEIFEKMRDKYAANQATLFKDCEEGELLYWLLANKWDEMAEHFVDLNGKLNHEEKKALILKRLRYRLDRADGSKKDQ